MDALDELFLELDDAAQREMVGTVKELNRRLAHSPHEEGESRGGSFRLTFADRLAVHFWIDDPNTTVRVTAVKRYGK